MQRQTHEEKQPPEPRKEVTERKRRFQIVKLEERIAPGGGHGNGSNAGCGGPTNGAAGQCHPYR